MTGNASMDLPYSDESANIIYNLLFCDDLSLYQELTEQPYTYPFDILLAPDVAITDLQKIADSDELDPRLKLLACNRLLAAGVEPEKKELMAVIIEVHLEEGLDVLASFIDGTARYINHSGKMVIWETTDDENAIDLTDQLFEHSIKIVNRIGPWDKPREPHPVKGNTRITFLVSDGLYFGEAKSNILFGDPMAGPALKVATNLMNHITVKAADR
jgi:hypothetical protein